MRRRFLVLVSMFFAAVSIVAIEIRFVRQQRVDLSARKGKTSSLERELDELRRQGDRAREELRLAEEQLARLPSVSIPRAAAGPTPRDPAVDAWLTRARQLRHLVAQRAGSTIPEMQLLSDEDWLQIARDASFETEPERRRTLASLRTTAKSRFVARLRLAVQHFTLGTPAAVPSDVAEIAARFSPPIDASVLARYEIKSGSSESRSSSWSIRERAPIDADYDTRVRVESTGSHGSSSGPFAWDDQLAEQVKQAYQSYAAAKPGVRPANFAEVIPYAQPPLAPSVVDRLLRLDRERQP